MDKRFIGRGKWSDIAIYKVLMSLIRKRPRDLVKLCTLAGREAFKDKSNTIKSQHFQRIFEEYSQGRIQDTINEYRSELPNIEKLLFGMKPNRKEITLSDTFVYTTAGLRQKINNIMEQNRFSFSNSKVANASELAHFLFKINFLTARKRMEDGEIERKYFEESRYLSSSSADFGYDWEVHPAYRWALQPGSMEDIFNKLSVNVDN